MTEGRDASGRFASGPCPDRGRGRPPAPPGFLLDEDLHRVVMATANLPVSIPRGHGRRVVTLYEALIRRLATGKVRGRAGIMDFIRLVQAAAASEPTTDRSTSPETTSRLEQHLERLRAAVASPDADPADRSALAFYELLQDAIGRRVPFSR